MLKKILYMALFIALAAGTVYCWQKVGFNRKTAMFFQVAFGDENSMGRPGGGPPMGENRGENMPFPGAPGGQGSDRGSRGESFGPPAMGEGGERGAPPEFGRRGNSGERPQGNGGPGGPPGGYISLGNVAKYTVIMAFAVMLTRLLDQLVLRWKRSRRVV